jgi:alpha-beta hydrolase superfamily lysophospholipase
MILGLASTQIRIMRTVTIWIIPLLFGCTTMKNLEKPTMPVDCEGYFYQVKDGSKLFIYDFKPIENYKGTIFIVSGITGINHTSEKDIIELLSNNENRVVVIHPRGTGYSDGTRGDIKRFADFINDYSEIISHDRDYQSSEHKIFLFGHSMSTAVLLAAAEKLKNVSGAILVNPPFMQKKAKGMSPGFWQYIKCAGYFLFAKHKPIVNMTGDPSKIENNEDRMESEARLKDSLLVKYFSMYLMNESGKLMRSMPEFCERADYPLLLIYGMNDSLVDKKGCDLIYEKWKHPNKKYLLIENGSHGKSTVKLAGEQISNWIENL